MSSHKNRLLSLDLTLPSTISSASINPALLFDETQQYKLCRKHEREKQAKSSNGSAAPQSKGVIGPLSKNMRKVQNMLFTSPLQKKLNHYGIKIKVSFSTKRKVFPLDDER